MKVFVLFTIILIKTELLHFTQSKPKSWGDYFRQINNYVLDYDDPNYIKEFICRFFLNKGKVIVTKAGSSSAENQWLNIEFNYPEPSTERWLKFIYNKNDQESDKYYMRTLSYMEGDVISHMYDWDRTTGYWVISNLFNLYPRAIRYLKTKPHQILREGSWSFIAEENDNTKLYLKFEFNNQQLDCEFEKMVDGDGQNSKYILTNLEFQMPSVTSSKRVVHAATPNYSQIDRTQLVHSIPSTLEHYRPLNKPNFPWYNQGQNNIFSSIRHRTNDEQLPLLIRPSSSINFGNRNYSLATRDNRNIASASAGSARDLFNNANSNPVETYLNTQVNTQRIPYVEARAYTPNLQSIDTQTGTLFAPNSDTVQRHSKPKKTIINLKRSYDGSHYEAGPSNHPKILRTDPTSSYSLGNYHFQQPSTLNYPLIQANVEEQHTAAPPPQPPVDSYTKRFDLDDDDDNPIDISNKNYAPIRLKNVFEARSDDLSNDPVSEEETESNIKSNMAKIL